MHVIHVPVKRLPGGVCVISKKLDSTLKIYIMYMYIVLPVGIPRYYNTYIEIDLRSYAATMCAVVEVYRYLGIS